MPVLFGDVPTSVNIRKIVFHLLVDVVDDGPGTLTAGTAGQGGGTGLAGLSERARLAGGWLATGSGPEGGFVVRAFLPDTR